MGIPFHRLPTLLNTSIPMMPDGPVTTGASGSGARQPRGGPARSHLWYRFGTDFLSFVLGDFFFKTTLKKGLGKDNFFTHNFEAPGCSRLFFQLDIKSETTDRQESVAPP